MVKLTPPGQGQTDWTEATVWTFSNVAQDINCTSDSLVMDASGALYGTTQYGDAADGFNGSVYKLVPPSGGLNGWTIENLYSFKSAQEGSNPQTQLTMGKDGVLYGIAPPGGVNNQGVVFEVMPSRNGKRTPTGQTIWNFTGGDDGSFRVGPVIVDRNGAIYGTAVSGGGSGSGMVFKPTPAVKGQSGWSETTLWSFTDVSDGIEPTGLVRHCLQADAAVAWRDRLDRDNPMDLYRGRGWRPAIGPADCRSFRRAVWHNCRWGLD